MILFVLLGDEGDLLLVPGYVVYWQSGLLTPNGTLRDCCQMRLVVQIEIGKLITSVRFLDEEDLPADGRNGERVANGRETNGTVCSHIVLHPSSSQIVLLDSILNELVLPLLLQ